MKLIPDVWTISSLSGEQNCVEVLLSDNVLVRNSKRRDGNVVQVSQESWKNFVEDIKSGSLNI